MLKKLSHLKNTPGRFDWLFLIPFICFAGGYFLIAHFYGAKEIQTPALIGKPLQEAARELSARNLNLRIITEKPDAELAAGTIVSQTPAAGKHIKENQSVFIVISRSLPRPLAPDCVNKPLELAQKELAGLQVKKYYLSSTSPRGYCFAQSPTAGTEITDRLILYISTGSNKPILWPDFTHKPIEYVHTFLKNNHIEPHILYPSEQPDNKPESTTDITSETVPSVPSLMISDQRPLAGSLLILEEEKMPNVQLEVQRAS